MSEATAGVRQNPPRRAEDVPSSGSQRPGHGLRTRRAARSLRGPQGTRHPRRRLGGARWPERHTALVARSLKAARKLPVAWEAVVGVAAGYADELMADLAQRPGMEGLEVWVGPGRSRPWQAKTIYMSALVIRWPARRDPVVLQHVEPIVRKSGPRQPWQLVQTAETAKDRMAGVLHTWLTAAP